MVGRSKPQKKMEPKPCVDFNSAENAYLKAKNLELAKALADSKAAYTQMVEDRDLIQRELFTMNLRCTKLENFIKNMELASRGCMSSIVMASNHATELLQNAHNALRLNLADDNIHTSIRSSVFNGSANPSSSSNKTQAVKPMIGGHVILRPTINLRRVNEIPIEEIQRLQSGSQTQNANRSSSENISSNDENQNQDDSTTHVRMFGINLSRNRHQPAEALMESFDNNEAEDEYTDHTSDISDAPSGLPNGLDTVQEEQEDELDHSLTSENRLNSLTNLSNTSLNLSGSGSQVPLLSGVFRDVRVYLSPMQNVAQYLDPRQHVTTERGSSRTHRSNRSLSIHSARSNENVTRGSSSSGENRRPSATNINSNSTSQNQTSSTATSASLDDSFTATLQNSLLSSTKISTPHRMNTSVSKPEDLNWIGVSNGRSPRCQPAFAENNRFNNIGKSKYLTVKLNHSDNRIVSKAPDLSMPSFSGSTRKCGPSTSDYDPLEGPSNMLDSVDDDTKNKIETMNGALVEPPPSPARTVLQRRELRKSDEKVKKSLYVTKRSAMEKKKTSIISTKVAKVMVKRLSLSRSRHSGSPQRRNSLSPRQSLDSSQRRLKLDSSRKSQKFNASPGRTKNAEEHKLNSSNCSSVSSASAASSRRGSLSIEKSPPKKRGRKSKQELLNSQTSKKSESPASPRRKVRPTRAAAQSSLKEPSLRKKMRRSK